MSLHKTISTIWKDWAEKEWYWAYPCLTSMIGSFISLGVHLWFLSGPARMYGLIGLIGLAVITETILWFRSFIGKIPNLKIWFWFHTVIATTVIGFELFAYFIA